MTARRAFWCGAACVGLCLLAFMALSGPIFFGREKVFDQRLCCYSFEDAIQYLAWLDMDPGRWPALARYRWIDMVFPLAVGVTVAAGLRLFWARGRVFWVGAGAALIFVVADYSENLSLVRVLDQAGAVFSGADVQRAATLTAVKWAALSVAAVLLYVGWRKRADDPRKGNG